MNKTRQMERHSGKRLRTAALLASSAACLLGFAALRAAAADDAAAAPAAPIAAMMAAHAEHGLLLSVVDTGKHLVAVGGNGDILLSDDGVHWQQVATPVDVTLTGVAFADEQHGWAVGHDALILHTADGGRSWAIQNYQPDLNAPMFAVLAIDAQKALAVGAFGTLKITEDGGSHWSDVDAPAVQQGKLHLNAATRLASGELLIAGEHGLVAVSLDGHQWQLLTAPYDGSFFGVLPRGAHGAIAYGLRGNAFATDDVHADHWQKVDTHTTSSFFGGLALPQDRIALVGSDGAVVRIDQTGTAQSLADSSRRKGQASSYAGGVRYRDRLLLVGESGVEQLALK